MMTGCWRASVLAYLTALLTASTNASSQEPKILLAQSFFSQPFANFQGRRPHRRKISHRFDAQCTTMIANAWRPRPLASWFDLEYFIEAEQLEQLAHDRLRLAQTQCTLLRTQRFLCRATSAPNPLLSSDVTPERSRSKRVQVSGRAARISSRTWAALMAASSRRPVTWHVLAS